ncbi:MAG: hypothetical protein IPM89_08430 [Candidatus Competibacteraceae bacterium]|nr:MAG: hypothetical protein IPM89_08430 [Candidatus Competibacteraceae bacterium]
MSIFLDIVSFFGSAASISGISIKDLTHKRTDLSELKNYIQYLETKNVLLAPLDDEVQIAVIRSIEEIKRETEDFRIRCGEESVKTILLRLILVMSEELHKLHNIDTSTQHGKYKMFLSLQRFRKELARALALFCSAFDIDPSNSRLKDFILNFSIRPRS